jgi:urocanate hydratase
MNTLTKEQVQAIVDDLAMLQAKHGIELGAVDNQLEIWPETKRHEVIASQLTDNSWVIDYNSGFYIDVVYSIDPERATAHQKMKFEEGLKR